jgi:hypothetical protein
MTNPNYTFQELDQIYVYTHESFKVNTRTSAGIITTGNLIPIKLSNLIKDANDPSEFTENTRIYFIGVDNWDTVGETDSNNFPTSIANVNMIVSFTDEGAEVVHEISCEWTGVINEHGFALFGFPSHKTVLSISADFSGHSSGPTPTPTTYGGIKNHTFTDMESFVSLSDELESVEDETFHTLNVNFSDNVDFNTFVYTSKSLFNNITESDRSANTFIPVSGGPSYCHFDEVPTTEFYGWCPLSKNSSSHMKQEDGTSGIKFNLMGDRDAQGNNTLVNNFAIVYGAPWIKDASVVDNTIIGLGYGENKEHYKPVGEGGSASWYDKWIKNNYSGAGIAFARYSAGYSIENLDFNDIKVKSSSMRTSVFASTCYGDVKVNNCSFTGSMETLSYHCWDAGIFFSNSYEDSSSNGTITMNNVNIDFYIRGGKYSAGMIGGVLRKRSTPIVHRFSNITINGYNNTEYWGIRNFVENPSLHIGNFYPSCFMAVVQANNNMVLDNVTINADLSSYKGDSGGNSGGILFGRLLGDASGTTEIVLKNVHLNGDFLYSSDNGQSGTSASCFVNDADHNNNPTNKTGRGLYPYDPLDSNLTDTQKDELSPSPYGRYNTDEDTEKTENGRSCSYLGHYLIGGYVRTGYLKFSLYNFNIKGQQIFANEFVSANLMDYDSSIHHYINDEGPFYVKEDVANANSNDGTSTKEAVVSQGSDKIFYYWKPNDPTDDALTKKFMINDVDTSYNI